MVSCSICYWWSTCCSFLGLPPTTGAVVHKFKVPKEAARAAESRDAPTVAAAGFRCLKENTSSSFNSYLEPNLTCYFLGSRDTLADEAVLSTAGGSIGLFFFGCLNWYVDSFIACS